MSTSRTRTGMWLICCVAAACMLTASSLQSGAGSGKSGTGLRVDVELLDSVQCWCSPLWGHNAPKVVEGKGGEVFVGLFSGEYPEANVRIMKRTASGQWQRGRTFTGAYQPSLLFIDGKGRLNIVQNSQTKPLLHFRSTDDANLDNFEKVAEGNGQADGRGWYVGAGVHNDTIYMAYILLSYDLFLTWKHVSDTSWNPAVLIHKGSVDTVRGNHSWTRPRFQFAGRKGFFVVNETSDGSVKNTYNAVQMVTFDQANPRQFTTECIDRVPQGFGAYSSDFAVAEDGWLYCVVERNGRIYGSVQSDTGDTGVFVFSREISGGQWESHRVFETLSDAALLVRKNGAVSTLRITRPGMKMHVDRIGQKDRANDNAVWEAVSSEDHASQWMESRLNDQATKFQSPSHIQLITGANSWSGWQRKGGVFEDMRGKVQGTKASRYGVYYFHVTESNE
jgi:hypothetical protein